MFEKRFFVRIGFALLIGLLFFYCHEAVHAQIFKYFGVQSEITVDLVGFHTVPLQALPIENWQQIQFLHALNEIVGYQIIFPFTLLLVYLLFKD